MGVLIVMAAAMTEEEYMTMGVITSGWIKKDITNCFYQIASSSVAHLLPSSLNPSVIVPRPNVFIAVTVPFLQVEDIFLWHPHQANPESLHRSARANQLSRRTANHLNIIEDRREAGDGAETKGKLLFNDIFCFYFINFATYHLTSSPCLTFYHLPIDTPL